MVRPGRSRPPLVHPAGTPDGRRILACRPSEVDLRHERGVRGVVKRKICLGDVVDYRVAVGATELRVQKGRRAPQLAEGAPCRLGFAAVHWYPAE